MIHELGVFLLFAIFSLANAAFDIQNCEGSKKTWVQDALDDAVHLTGRAAQTLDEALNSPIGIRSQVKIILDAFLSPQANQPGQPIYRSILEIFNSINSKLQSQSVSILYTCQDLTFPSPDGQDLFYPVSLSRIGGRPNPRGIKGCDPLISGSNYIFDTEAANPDADLAFTLTSVPGNIINRNQLTCTGSDSIWSDMTLLKVLDSTDNGNIVTFEQWPSFLGKSNWKEIVGFESYPRPTEKSLNVQYIMSVVILHELMHSVGIPSPIDEHSFDPILKKSAYAFFSVLQTANIGNLNTKPIPLNENPSTLAFLCLSLAMPWYKLFDQKSQSWDGIVRYNLDDKGGVWFPNWVANGQPPTDDLREKAYEMGPYYQP